MITTEKFMVNSDTERIAAARYATENFARQVELDRENTLRLELLVEETLGMVKAMLEEFSGQIWFVDDGGVCEIHFEATANMDAGRAEGLISVSSTGKNAAKGFMAKLGGLITGALHGTGKTMKYGAVHKPEAVASAPDMTPIWTLQNYRSDLEKARGESDEAEKAREEMEKSIVAKLADDIVVGVRGNNIDMVIKKAFLMRFS